MPISHGLPSLPPAEALDASAVRAQIDVHLGGLGTPHLSDHVQNRLAATWLLAELAMNPATSPEERDELWTQCLQSNEAVLAMPALGSHMRANALLLKAFTPYFHLRPAPIHNSPRVREEVMRGYHAVVEKALAAPIHNHDETHLAMGAHGLCFPNAHDRASQIEKISVIGLVMRTTQPVMPASYREAYPRGDDTQYAHDMYIMPGNNTKTPPIKVRHKPRTLRGRKYGGGVVVVPYSSLVSQSLARLEPDLVTSFWQRAQETSGPNDATPQSRDDTTTAARFILELQLQELQLGNDMPDFTRRVLRVMTRVVRDMTAPKA